MTTRGKWVLAAIVLGALFVRTGFVLTRAPVYAFPDSTQYAGIAKNLLAEGSFAFDEDRKACRGPGYPVFLAGCFAMLGESAAGVRLVQAVIGAATCLLVFALARGLFGQTAGLIAGALAAIYPFFIFYTGLVLTETLFIATLAGAMLLLVRAERSRWRLLAAGVVTGVGILIRPSMLLMAPLLAIWWACRRPAGRRILEGMAFLAIAWGCLGPWVWRNYRIFEHFVPTTLTTGESLYEANSPYATGGPAMHIIPWGNAPEGLTEYERDVYYQKLAKRWIKQNPGAFARLACVKLRRFWNIVPNDVNHRRPALMAASVLSYVPVVLLAIAGICLNRRRWREAAFLLIPAAYFSALHMVFVGSIRYRAPVMPFLIVLAAAGVVGLLCPKQQQQATNE